MRLIASDLDGTLLNEKGLISIENKVAIEKAIEAGYEFVVATGRSYEAANKPLQAVGLTCPIISLNGAVSYTEDGQEVSSVPLDRAVAKQILEVCQEADMYMEFFTNKGIFSRSREYFMEVLIDIMKSANANVSEEEVRDYAEQRFQMEAVTFLDRYEEIFDMDDVIVYKVLSFSLAQQVLQDVRTKVEGNDGVTITSSGDINLEFNHPNAQKGIALEALAKEKGIAITDVMAIGDNWNDASMLKAAGRGVAMKNAAEGIKELCDYETTSNEENGVAAAIEEMMGEV